MGVSPDPVSSRPGRDPRQYQEAPERALLQGSRGMKKLYLAVPSMGEIQIGLNRWILNQGTAGKYSLVLDTPCQLRNVDYARNFLAKKFLETDCEYLAMVDSDVIPDDPLLAPA